MIINNTRGLKKPCQRPLQRPLTLNRGLWRKREVLQSNLQLGPRGTLRQGPVIKQRKVARGVGGRERERGENRIGEEEGACGLLALQFKKIGVNSCEDLGENLVGSCFPCVGILVGWLISPLSHFLPPLNHRESNHQKVKENQTNTNPTHPNLHLLYFYSFSISPTLLLSSFLYYSAVVVETNQQQQQ